MASSVALQRNCLERTLQPLYDFEHACRDYSEWLGVRLGKNANWQYRVLIRGVCRVCNDLSPFGHFASKATLSSIGAGPHTYLNFSHNTSIYRKSAWRGCQYCDLICQALDLALVAFSDIHGCALNDADIAFMSVGITEEEPAVVRLVSGNVKLPFDGLQLYALPETERTVLPSLGESPQIAHHPASNRCIEFIQQRLEECWGSHPDCALYEARPLPKRVLEIASDSHDLRLVEPGDENHREIGFYAALSHCWGGGRPFMVTRETLEDAKRSVAWDSLPTTFQDAITITSKLGLKYLWIDSLCILQGDQEDWETESAKMAFYYGSAYVTIAGSSSGNPNESFLKPRLAGELRLAGDGCPVGVRRCPSDRLKYGPLNQRAWCFQETVLSPHILHFTSDQVIFECQTHMHAEDGRKVTKQDQDVERRGPAMSHHLSRIYIAAVEGSPDPQIRSYQLWQDIVTIYTRLQLSRESDRLPAISGVAMRFGGRNGSQYLAGLWRDNFIADLIWTVPEDKRGFSGLVDQPCPSWSWASIQRGVWYSEPYIMKPHAKLLRDHCEVSGLNRFGTVKSGSCTLLSRLLELKLSSVDPDDPRSYRFSDDRIHYRTLWKLRPDVALEQHILVDDEGHNVVALRRRLAGSVKAEPFSDVPVFCLEVAGFSNPGDLKLTYLRCLLLSYADASMLTFKRIGHVDLRPILFDNLGRIEVTIE